MTLAHDVAGPGDGPPVVLLHSSACDRRQWDPQWDALAAAGLRVVRCDLRGFGETPLDDDATYTNAGDVLDLTDGLGLGPFALVGSSFGGRVALEVAATRPDAVTTLALLCPARPGQVPTDDVRAFGDREDELLEAGDVDGAVELNVATWLGPEAGDDARAALRTMQRRAFDVQLAASDEAGPQPVETDLAAITARCLAVGGAHDLELFRAIPAELPDLLTGTTTAYVELPWAGHLPNLERLDEVTTLLTEFLRA